MLLRGYRLIHAVSYYSQRVYPRNERRVAAKNVPTNVTVRRQKAFKNEITSAAVSPVRFVSASIVIQLQGNKILL
jgi:hypothetical protein